MAEDVSTAFVANGAVVETVSGRTVLETPPNSSLFVEVSF